MPSIAGKKQKQLVALFDQLVQVFEQYCFIDELLSLVESSDGRNEEKELNLFLNLSKLLQEHLLLLESLQVSLSQPQQVI